MWRSLVRPARISGPYQVLGVVAEVQHGRSPQRPVPERCGRALAAECRTRGRKQPQVVAEFLPFGQPPLTTGRATLEFASLGPQTLLWGVSKEPAKSSSLHCPF